MSGAGAHPYASKRVLVTGGAGFIGSNLALRLVDLGAEVAVLDAFLPDCGANAFNLEPARERIRLIRADLRDREAAAEALRGREIVFNLAGQVSHIDSMTDPRGDLGVNCDSHLVLLEACRRTNPAARVIYAGTRQQYGRPRYTPVDENHPLCPTDVNGINKLAAEWYHRLYARLHGLHTISLRLTNTYGPRQLIRHDRQGFLAVFIRRALDGEPLRVFGDGRQLRDLNYVDDVVDAFLSAGTGGIAPGEVFNLGSPEVLSLRRIADLMVGLAGRGSVELVPFPDALKQIDIGSYHGDFGKIHRVLGWAPRVSFEEGMRRTLAYYRSNGAHYRLPPGA